MAKLYTVEMKLEIVVIAESESEAEEAAEDAWHEMSVSDASVNAFEMSHLPWGWEGGELPWRPNDDLPERTVDEWIEAGAAPKLVAARDRNRKALATHAATLPNGSAPEGDAKP